MGAAAVPALWFLPAALPIAIWVAWSDMATMKIPNKAVLALTAVFLVIGAIALPWAEYFSRMLHFVVVLAIGFALSIAGVFGAGDAKFAAAMAPFVALYDVTSMIILFAIAVLFGFATHRGARSVPAIRSATPDWVSWEETKKFPMGYPLALALIAYLVIRVMRG